MEPVGTHVIRSGMGAASQLASHLAGAVSHVGMMTGAAAVNAVCVRDLHIQRLQNRIYNSYYKASTQPLI